MKIMIGGEFLRGTAGALIANSFEKLGIEVVRFDYGVHFSLTLFNRLYNKLKKLPHYFNTHAVNSKLVSEARRSNPLFILLLKPVLIRPETVDLLRRQCPIYSWYADYLEFLKNSSDYFYDSIPLYDICFSTNVRGLDGFIRAGARKSQWLMISADSSCHYPISVSKEDQERYGADVVFVGTYAPEMRESYLEKLCMEGYGIKIYGNDWHRVSKKSALRNTGAIQFRSVACEEMSKVFNSSKITLSFVREHNYEVLACRTFEIPASGGFMLHQWTEFAPKYFQEGIDAEYFRSYEEMKEKIDYYLSHETERKAIAKAGCKRFTENNYGMVGQARKLLEIIGLSKSVLSL